tara:strand:- start:22 stop:498 length:477 start_codon:yes stop_codon:yes gene_type:complete
MKLTNIDLIKNNFFDDVDYIRQIALGQDYTSNTGTSHFRGMRADVPDSIYEDVSRQILETLNMNSGKIYLWFAYQTGDLQIDENCIHTDDHSTAGLIYLHDNPKPNSGTILYNNEKKTIIENKYNRFISYSSSTPHSPEGFYGDNINNARMTLTYFID